MSFVFSGDSFSAVGYNSKDRHPCVDHPLGIEFPGLTSCERVDETTGKVTYEPNWVGHFVQTVNAKRIGHPLLVYDYAVSGDTVARMKLWQVEKEFLPHLAPHPEWAPWTPSDTLFVTWIGINDCTYNIRLQPSAAQRSFDDLFAAQEELYTAGARNFCFVDVPLAHTFPKGESNIGYDLSVLLLICGGRAEDTTGKRCIYGLEPHAPRACIAVQRSTCRRYCAHFLLLRPLHPCPLRSQLR